ncbi:hypothetical protein EEJ42_34770 [Streptomyces botrytidirepellens]|uniref:Uncharacterized protein n=1 Tax=Streptomyces botrytidirepellens TaxID=2486417 RepID=A0A3M8UDE2_9ACTN|nr:hypothetical protein EEJ42_34770 [Streptomyces botrytidirepellens]
MTTGGMGREPGMLIRMRVVRVVSVFGSSGLAAASASPSPTPPWRASGDGDRRDPYGGVPDG